MKRKALKITIAVLRYGFLILLAFFMMFPFYWSIVCSFLPDSEIYNMGLTIIPKFSALTLENYAEVFKVLDVFRYLGNTLLVTVCNVVGTLLLSFLCAYGIEVVKFRGNTIVFTILLAAMMIPGSVTSIPTYKLMDGLNLLDSLGSLILPGMLSISCMLFFRSFLIDIGKEARESMQLDGANEFQICFVLYAPIVVPAFIAQGVFCLLANWNNYYQPMLYLYSEENYTLALALWQKQAFFQKFGSVLGSSILLTIPMFIVFIVLQKYFMTGIRVTGTKD